MDINGFLTVFRIDLPFLHSFILPEFLPSNNAKPMPASFQLIMKWTIHKTQIVNINH